MKSLLGLILLFIALVVFGIWWDYERTVDGALSNTQPVMFEVKKGQSLPAVAEALKQQGLLKRPRWLRFLAWRQKDTQHLKFGEYEIPPGTSVRELLAMFVAGKVHHYSFTLVEGWNFRQMLEALNRQNSLNHQIKGKSAQEIMGMIEAPGEEAEGRFFPDTYFYSRDTEDLEILRRAYRKMQKVLAEEWQNKGADTPVSSPYQALILASIVEKETGLAEERPRIAGVFARRLSKGMLLQTDPTVIYGMGEAYTGNIRKDDLLRDTPYNTYVRAGLPPTPISMPGLAAIKASLHPEPGEFLYFVAKGDGGHIFTRTLPEHNQAVEQYQKKHHD